MYFINITHGMPYSKLQKNDSNISNNSYKIFPEKYLSEFYKSGKLFSGFVKYEINPENTSEVINVEWDEIAYQNYLIENGYSDETEPTLEEDTASMLVDHEYRITLLELGV